MREDLRGAAVVAREQSLALRVRSETVLAEAERLLDQARDGTLGAGKLAELTEQVEGLRTAMESRAAIEQAKGILIATTGCDAETAFSLLVQESQHSNRKLREVARDLVASKVRLNP